MWTDTLQHLLFTEWLDPGDSMIGWHTCFVIDYSPGLKQVCEGNPNKYSRTYEQFMNNLNGSAPHKESVKEHTP